MRVVVFHRKDPDKYKNKPYIICRIKQRGRWTSGRAPLVRGTFTALILAVRGVSEQSKYMALATTDPETGQLSALDKLATEIGWVAPLRRRKRA